MELEDGSERIVERLQREKNHKFIEEVGDQFRDTYEALEDVFATGWDKSTFPLSFFVNPDECIEADELLKTENTQLSESLLRLTTLCQRMDELIKSGNETFLPILFVYGDPIKDETLIEPGENEAQMAQSLEALKDASQFVKDCQKAILEALAFLCDSYPQSGATSFTGTRIHSLWSRLAQTLTTLVTVDAVVMENSLLRDHFRQYRQMLKVISQDPDRFAASEEDIGNFEEILVDVEITLLQSSTFQTIMTAEIEGHDRQTIFQNRTLSHEMMEAAKAMHTESLNPAAHRPVNRQLVVGAFAIYAVWFSLFHNVDDKKFLKQLFETHKKIPFVHLFGDIMWYPADFLLRYAPHLCKLISDVDTRPHRIEYLKQKDASTASDVQTLSVAVSKWLVSMRDTSQAGLIIEGLNLAETATTMVKDLLSVHAALSIPLGLKQVRCLVLCIQLAKAIESAFFRVSRDLAEVVINLSQVINEEIIKTLTPIRARLQANQKFMNPSSEPHAAVLLMENLLVGNNSSTRLIGATIAFEFVKKTGLVQDSAPIYRYLDQLAVLVSLGDYIENSASCGFLYAHRNLIPTILSDIYSRPARAGDLNYLLPAFADCHANLLKAVHSPKDGKTLVETFSEEVQTALMTELVEPLCHEIENDLRLHIHAHLKVDTRDPWKSDIKDVARLLLIKPIPFMGITISIKDRVRHYLDTTFYNLTTVNLGSWRTYEGMRDLAFQKYSIKLSEVYLPGSTLEQGLDVLEVMRNIHVFVTRFNYNLNTQLFIERESESKFLHTINIVHIANSIRTHGTGIANTAVNFTYQFLIRKLHVFSDFLFNDHIKSRLIKDARFFKELKTDNPHSQYPYDRALQFTKEIRRLGVTSDDQTYLDRFRVLITEIGNTMAFVRLVRSGVIHHISNAIKYVPDLTDIPCFTEQAEKDKMPEETVKACKNLDAVVENLDSNFSEGTEYNKLLVEAFKDQLRSETNIHLKNFFLIIPPLIINYVDYISDSKERLMKNRGDGLFTDDGFALGLAYLIKTLDHDVAFDSLHWFDSIRTHYNEQTAITEEELSGLKKGKKDQALVSTAQIQLQKIASFLSEYEQIFYSLAGARVFFRA